MDRPGSRLALSRLAPPVVGAALFAAALAALHGELREVRWADLTLASSELPRGRLWLAAAFTAVNYAVLAVSWAGRALHRGWVAVAGLVSHAVSNGLGAGVAVSLLKRGDYEEVTLSFAAISVVLALAPSPSAARGAEPPPPRAAAPAPVAAPAAPRESSFVFPPLGPVHVYAPTGPPRQVVLFLSGDGGWNLGVVPMAKRLAAEGALVAGVDVRRLLASLRSAAPCPYPAGTLEELSRAVQLRAGLPEYRRPILVGYSSGATLVYAALAQAPRETFRGAISLGFCKDVALGAPLCRGRGLASSPRAKGPGRDLEPLAGLDVPWVVLHGDADQVCSVDEAQRFVGQVPSARVVRLPKVGHGFAVTPRWEPQYVAAYRSFAEEPAVGSPSAPAVAGGGPSVERTVGDLGLVEVEATAPPSSPALGELFAVILTGDGGWAEIDKSLAERFAAAGVPSLGWSSLKYYWTPRTPEGAAADLARVIEHGAARFRRGRVLLVGYSFGADALPFLAARLPPAARARVARVGLVGLSPRASFEFHVAGWLGLDKGEYPTLPEVKRLAPIPVACVAGDDERDSACGALRGAAEVVVLPGGHHFGGDYARGARALLPPP